MKLSILILAAAVGCASVQTATPEQGRISVSGTRFVRADGSPFEWRGITAFRLAGLVAEGREREAADYLDWAAARGVTVVRVLAMARHLFALSPAEGLRALPRLLDLAATRGMHVEIVALADTASFTLDLDAHVRAVGAIAARHPNALVEIANEPVHPTQHPSLHESTTLERLAALVPEEVVVAYGEYGEGIAAGDYVTVHTHRGEQPWDHVLSLAEGRELVDRLKRPVVSDEPIGAGERREPGRRDNSPERFRASAILTRMTGMYATFHYEGGLQARIPEGVERDCFEAWTEAWSLLPEGVEQGAFRRLPAETGHAFETRLDGRRWVLTVGGAAPPPGLDRAAAWRESALWKEAPGPR